MSSLLPLFGDYFNQSIEFHIYGSGGKLEELKSRIIDNNLTNIHLHPPVARNEVPNLSICRYLVSNAQPEAAFRRVIPSKLFEYASTSKPILAGLHGHSRDFAEREIPGIYVYKPDSFSDMKDQFNLLLKGKQNFDRKKFMKGISVAK